MARGRCQAASLILLVALVAGAWAADPVPAAKPAAAAAKPEVKAAGNAADAAALAAAEAAGMPGDAQKHVSIPANSNAVASTMQVSSLGKSNSTAPVLTDRFWDCLCNKTSAEELKKTPTAKAWSCACSLKNKDQATAPKQQPAAAVPPAAKAPQAQPAPKSAQAPQQPQQAAPPKPVVPTAAAPKAPVAAPKTPEAPKEVVKQPEAPQTPKTEAPKAVEQPQQTEPAPAAESKTAEPALPTPAAVEPVPVAEPAPVQQPAPVVPRTVVGQDFDYQNLRRRGGRSASGAVGGGARAFQRPGPGMPGGMGLGRSMPSARSVGGLPNRPFASSTPPPMDTLRRAPGGSANSQPGLPVDDTINKLPFTPAPAAGGMPMPTSNMDRLHGNGLPHAPAGGNALNEQKPHGLDVSLRPGFGRGSSSNPNNHNGQQQQAGNNGLPNMPAAVDQQQPLSSHIPRGYGRDSYSNRGPYGSNPRGPAYNREQYGRQYPEKRYQESPRYGPGPDKYGRPEYPEPQHEEADYPHREHERYYEEPKYERKYEDDKYAPPHHEPKYAHEEEEPYERSHHEEEHSDHEDSYEPRKRYYEDDEHNDEGYYSHGEESEHEDEYEPRYRKGGSHKVLEEPEEEEQTLIIGGKKLVNKSKKASGVKGAEGEDATAADGADFKRSFAPNIQEEDVPSPIPGGLGGAPLQANKEGVLLVTELKMVEGFKGECNAKSVDWVQERASRLLVAELDSVGIKSKIKSALWTCAVSRDGNVQESLYGRLVMKFVMQIEPVCDYRAYLRKFSCSTTRLIPELAKALSAVSDNDMCVFRLGQPDRQCKKMDTSSYIVTQRELPSLSELQNWAELDLAKAPTWDGVGFKPWSADVAPYDPSDPYGLKGGEFQKSSSSKKKTKEASKPSEDEQKWDKVLESEHTEQADPPPVHKPELPTEPIHKPEMPPTAPPTTQPPVADPVPKPEDPPHPPETRPELPPQQPTPPPLKQQEPIATPPTLPPVNPPTLPPVVPPVTPPPVEDNPVDPPDDPRNPTDPRPPTTTPTQPPATPPTVPSDNVAPSFGQKVKLVTSSMRRLLSNFDPREVM